MQVEYRVRKFLIDSILIAAGLMAFAPLADGIIRGEIAKEPGQRAAIYVSNSGIGTMCSGVLIHERILLTAGHCTRGASSGWLTFSNSANTSENVERALPILKVETSPAYSGPKKGVQSEDATSSDIGVIVFKESVLKRFKMSTADLPRLAADSRHLNSILATSKDLKIVGYGWSMPKGEIRSPSKRQLSVRADSDAESSLLNATSVEPTKTACFGDSGAGLFANQSSTPGTLLGILSSIAPGGKLAEAFAAERREMRAKWIRKHKNDKNPKPMPEMHLSQDRLANVCGDADTIQRVTTIASHLCWIQSVSGVVLDPDRYCDKDEGDQ